MSRTRADGGTTVVRVDAIANVPARGPAFLGAGSEKETTALR